MYKMINLTGLVKNTSGEYYITYSVYHYGAKHKVRKIPPSWARSILGEYRDLMDLHKCFSWCSQLGFNFQW